MPAVGKYLPLQFVGEVFAWRCGCAAPGWRGRARRNTARSTPAAVRRRREHPASCSADSGFHASARAGSADRICRRYRRAPAAPATTARSHGAPLRRRGGRPAACATDWKSSRRPASAHWRGSARYRQRANAAAIRTREAPPPSLPMAAQDRKSSGHGRSRSCLRTQSGRHRSRRRGWRRRYAGRAGR